MKELLESSYLSAMSNINQELRDRINKAIEYVENNNFYKTGMTEEGICYVVSCDKKELLDILKGSDSNGHNKE